MMLVSKKKIEQLEYDIKTLERRSQDLENIVTQFNNKMEQMLDQKMGVRVVKVGREAIEVALFNQLKEKIFSEG